MLAPWKKSYDQPEKKKRKKESEVAQACPTLCNPMDCSPSGSSVHGIIRQEYWSGLPFPSPGDLPNPGIEPRSPALLADALLSEPPGKPSKEFIELQINDARLLCHGILQARKLEWVDIHFSRGYSRLREQVRISHMAGRFFTI